MKVKELLIEMPQNLLRLSKIDDLSIVDVNRAKFHFLSKLENKKVIEELDNKHQLINVDNIYFVLDYSNKKVLYYMEYNTSFSNKVGSFLWQSLVWRDKNSPIVLALPHKIFFEILLPKYKVISTDGKQTDDGKRFWYYQIGYAFKNNLNVYYFNLQSKELLFLENNTVFLETVQKYDIWGDTKDHQNKLILITSKNLIDSKINDILK
jgi:hypothetical protein